MGTINEIDDVVANSLLSIQQKFYSENASFVICEIGPSLEQYLKNLKIFQMSVCLNTMGPMTVRVSSPNR